MKKLTSATRNNKDNARTRQNSLQYVQKSTRDTTATGSSRFQSVMNQLILSRSVERLTIPMAKTNFTAQLLSQNL